MIIAEKSMALNGTTKAKEKVSIVLTFISMSGQGYHTAGNVIIILSRTAEWLQIRLNVFTVRHRQEKKRSREVTDDEEQKDTND